MKTLEVTPEMMEDGQLVVQRLRCLAQIDHFEGLLSAMRQKQTTVLVRTLGNVTKEECERALAMFNEDLSRIDTERVRRKDAGLIDRVRRQLRETGEAGS